MKYPGSSQTEATQAAAAAATPAGGKQNSQRRGGGFQGFWTSKAGRTAGVAAAD